MSKGKFSQPRPNRNEEREIERAFRQVTGQELPPEAPAQDPFALDPNTLDTIFEEGVLADVLPEESVPQDTPAGFSEKAMAFLNRAVDFFSGNRKIALLALCSAALILIVLFMSIFFISTSDPYDKTILNNVIIADVNVGGMTKDQAISAVKQATAHTYPVLDMVVDLSGMEIRLAPADTGVSLDVKAAVNEAYSYGRTGTKAEQEKAYQDSLTGNHIIGLLPYLDLNEDHIRKVLEEYSSSTGSTLTQTSYGLEGGLPNLSDKNLDPNTAPTQTLVIIMGTPGIRFDVNAVFNQIMDAYSLHDFMVTVTGLDTVSEPDPVDLDSIYSEFYVAPVNATVDLQNYQPIPGSYGYGFNLEKAKQLVEKARYGEEIRIPMEYIAPAALNADMFFQDVLAEYETTYKDRSNLQTNLILACEAINGKIINPGESFSFNDAVGQRTSAKGYKYADDQIGTEKNRILGGGISQVSSALYYCTMVADIEVTQRTNHSLIPGYSDYGLDAAVGWSTPDLKFTNTLGLPIQIQALAADGKVQIAILGTDERDYFVAMDYEISGTRAFQTEYKDFKAKNEEGYKDGDVIQEGINGYIVKTYRLKYDDKTGELISRDYVATTQYLSLPKIIARVEKVEETTPTEETTAPTEAPTEAPTVKPTETTPPATESTEAPSTQAPTEAAVETAPPETQSPETPASDSDDFSATEAA